MVTLKKTLRRYDVLNFQVRNAFPPESPLAIDLLRLMSAYNDIYEVIDWMVAHQTTPKKPMAIKKYRVRAAIQHRILIALMHEAFKIIDQLQSGDEYKKAEGLLSQEGKESLRNLRLAQQGGSDSMRARLSLGRNKVIFHYDSEEFREGLTTLLRIFPDGQKSESQVVIQDGGRAYYLLPEEIRDIIVYRFESQINAETVEQTLGPFLAEVTRLQKELFGFLEDLLIAYMKLRGLDHLFRRTVVKE